MHVYSVIVPYPLAVPDVWRANMCSNSLGHPCLVESRPAEVRVEHLLMKGSGLWDLRVVGLRVSGL